VKPTVKSIRLEQVVVRAAESLAIRYANPPSVCSVLRDLIWQAIRVQIDLGAFDAKLKAELLAFGVRIPAHQSGRLTAAKIRLENLNHRKGESA